MFTCVVIKNFSDFFKKIVNFVIGLLLKMVLSRKYWRKHKSFSAKMFEYDWSTYLPSFIVIEHIYEKILGGGEFPQSKHDLK